MRHLGVARVGEYVTFTEELTPLGIRQFYMLSKRIKAQIGGSSVLLLTSDADRALACAAIMGEVLGVGFEPHREFFSDATHPPDLSAAYRLVKEREGLADAIIVVSHYDIIGQFPMHFAMMREFVARSWSAEKASAFMLDLTSHELVHVRGS